MLILQSNKETYRTNGPMFMVGWSLKDVEIFPKIPSQWPHDFSHPHGVFVFGLPGEKEKVGRAQIFHRKTGAVPSDDQNHGWLG